MVSIIILSYNTENLLRDCLASLKNTLKEPHEIIVVDNASKDGSVKMVEKEFPKVRLIKNPTNVGFAGGCNLGAKNATGEYLLFLNSDITLESDILFEFMKTMKSDDNNAVIGGLLQNNDGTLQRSYGDFYDLKNVAYMLFLGEKHEVKRFQGEKIKTVDWVSGGCMFVKKSVFDKVGGFDEKFFMYIEDMELCYRIRKEGLKILVTPQVKVTHLGQGSSNKTFAIVNIFKGLQYFYKKHRSTLEYRVVRLLLHIKAVSGIVIGRITGNTYLYSTYSQALKVL